MRKHASGGGGGEDEYGPLKTAEIYDTSAGQWRALPDMSVERCACAAVCIEGNVYVVGGHDGHSSESMKSAEMYDRSAGQWRALPDMSMAR
jgi:hypothetical protein